MKGLLFCGHGENIDWPKRVFEKSCSRSNLPPRDSKNADFEDINLRPRYNLRRSLTFQTPSKQKNLPEN